MRPSIKETIAVLNSASSAVERYGAVGDGVTDDTAAIQAAARSGSPLVFTKGKTYLTRSLSLPSNARLLGYGATLKLAPDQPQYCSVLILNEVANVGVFGLTIDGNRARQNARDPDQDGGLHGIAIIGSKNVTVEDVLIRNCYTDGIYLSDDQSYPGDRSGNGSAGIRFNRVVCDRNGRQGLSVVQGSDIVVTNSSFVNTAGTDPAFGIDLEPNSASQDIVNIEFRGCLIRGNAGGGILAYIRGGTLRNAIFVDCKLEANGPAAIVLDCLEDTSVLEAITLDNIGVTGAIRIGRSKGRPGGKFKDIVLDGIHLSGPDSWINVRYAESDGRMLIRNCHDEGSSHSPRIRLEETNNVLIQGNTLSRGTNAVQVSTGARQLYIESNEFRDFSGAAITVDGASEVVALSNVIDGCAIGIRFQNVTTGHAADNIIKNCRLGIQRGGSTLSANTFSGNARNTD